jgi:DNA-binding transcriptional LysR family regulator
VENFGPDLITRTGKDAPGVRLRFVQKPNRDSGPLRDGTVDLETGIVGKTTGPEVRAQALFRDRFIGVVRMGHPLTKGKITPSCYATGRHILVSRRGLDTGPIDEA